MQTLIRLNCTEGSGHFYTTSYNKRNRNEKLVLKKYNPKLRRVVIYKEAKIK